MQDSGDCESARSIVADLCPCKAAFLCIEENLSEFGEISQ